MSTFGNPLTEYTPQMEGYEYTQPEQESGGEVFSETEEVELTAQLLGVNNEQDLENFLGDLINKAGSAIRNFASSPAGQAVGGLLKTVAKQALPLAGQAAGAYFGGPLGAQIGGALASVAGQALGLELEGLSQEDKEFEAARQFVKFAGETVKNALQAAPNVDPAAVANAAAVEAARVHAPGLLTGTSATENRSGRWVRRPGIIILFGV